MESTAVVPAFCRLRTHRSGYLEPGRIDRAIQQAIAVVKGETVLVDATAKSFGVARSGLQTALADLFAKLPPDPEQIAPHYDRDRQAPRFG